MDIRFEEHFKVQIDGELRTVRFTVSDRGHPEMRDYGDDYYYMHFTTNETRVTPVFYEDLLFFLDIVKSKNKKLKNTKYKVTMVLEGENVGLHIRVNEKEPYSYLELEQLIEGVLEFFENKYNIDDMINENEVYAGGVVAGLNQDYQYEPDSDINGSDYNSEISTQDHGNLQINGYHFNDGIEEQNHSHHDYRQNIGALQQSQFHSEINSADRDEILAKVNQNEFKDEEIEDSEVGGNYDLNILSDAKQDSIVEKEETSLSNMFNTEINKEDFLTVRERTIEELHKMGVGVDNFEIPLTDPDNPTDEESGESDKSGGKDDDILNKYF